MTEQLEKMKLGDEHNSSPQSPNWLKTYRWFFLISLIQVVAYFVGPLVLFPARMVGQVEIISALTLGLVVALFFLLVNVAGLFYDPRRKWLYLTMLICLTLYFAWALISWLYIEQMTYLFR